MKCVLRHSTCGAGLRPENNVTCFKTDSTCGAGLSPENNVTCFKTGICLKTRYIIFMT
jgi:hypothetical protein